MQKKILSQKLRNLLPFLVILFFVSSCNQEIDDITEPLKSTEFKSATLGINTSNIDKGEIIPLQGERDQNLNSLARSYSSISNELYELNELPIFIEVKENSLGSGNRFLKTNGRGREIVLSRYENSDHQKFYIKVPPSSTGIPYLIYSYKENMPISVGSYSSNPDKKVLYTRRDASGSLFGASWDFKKGENTEFSYVIQNNDLIGSGGNPWDTYRYVVGVKQNSIHFDRYTKLASQEFQITPVETFSIQSIEFVTDATATLNKLPNQVVKDGYANYGHIDQQKEFVLTKEVVETSSYTKKSITNVKVEATIKARVPFIAEGEIRTSVSQGLEFTYGKSEQKKRTVTHRYPVTIPAGYRADLSLIFFAYEMDLDYIAKCTGDVSGRSITIRGRWKGISVEETEATLKLTNLNDPSQSRTFKLTPSVLFKAQP